MLCLALFSSNTLAEYTLQSFREATTPVDSDEDLVRICKDFCENAEDIDVIRNAQSMWSDIDNASALKHYSDLRQQQPDSKEILYLYGRILEDPLEQIRIGREIIKNDATWEYGYRLLLAIYDQHLLTLAEPDEVSEKLAIELEADKAYFDKFAALDLDPEFAARMMFDYQMYSNDYEAALPIIENGIEAGYRWAMQSTLGDLLVKLGRNDEAREAFASELELYGPAIPEDQKSEIFTSMYISSLRDIDDFSGATEYLLSIEGIDTKCHRLYDIACLYSLSGDADNAFTYLNKAAKCGFDEVRKSKADQDLVSLHDDPRWEGYVSAVQANWDSGAEERRGALMSEKVDKPIPQGNFTDVNGEVVQFSDFAGSVVVLDFWATWCGPCRMAMPVIDEFVKKNGNDKIKVFSVNTFEKGRKKASDFMVENEYAMGLLFSSDDYSRAFGVSGIPHLCVIDRNGKIRFEHIGYTEDLYENLQIWTQDLLND